MNHSIRRRVGGICLVCALVGPAQGLDEFSPLLSSVRSTVSVPAEVLDHTMYVMVSINHAGPFRMLVDTGCTTTVISPSVAAAIVAPVSDDEGNVMPAFNGLGDVTKVQPMELATLDLGAAHFDGVAAAVGDAFDLPSKIVGKRVDGTLGFSLFADLVVALDYPNQQLILGPEMPANLPPARAELPLHLGHDVPFVTAALQGTEVELEMDTGSNRGLQIPPEIARRLSWQEVPRPGTLVSVFGETQRGLVGRLAGALTLGGASQATPIADVDSGFPSVGSRFLENFCVVFDREHEMIRLCSARSGEVAAPPERSLGLSMLAEDSGWRVVAVIPDSPAVSAGIEPGDLITRFETQPAQTWSRDQLSHWIDTHPALTLRVEHAAASRDVALPVWVLVP